MDQSKTFLSSKELNYRHQCSHLVLQDVSMHKPGHSGPPFWYTLQSALAGHYSLFEWYPSLTDINNETSKWSELCQAQYLSCLIYMLSLKFFLLVLHTIFFQNHWLLSNITIVKKWTAIGEKWILTQINPWEKKLAKLGIKPAISCSEILCTTDWATMDLIHNLSFLRIFIFYYYFNPIPNKPSFLRVCSTSLLKTLWEKKKLLVTSNFSFSHSVFYPFRERSSIFIEFDIVICKRFQFGRV